MSFLYFVFDFQDSKRLTLILYRIDSEKLQLVVFLYLFRYNLYFNFVNFVVEKNISQQLR